VQIKRLYTKAGENPLASINFIKRTSEIKNPDGSVVFKMEDIMVPDQCSQVAVDIIAQKYFRKEIRDLINYLCNEKNKTIFLSSHILSEVELVANRMIIINKGKTVVEGKVQELLDSAEMKVTIEVDDVDATGQLIKDSGWAEKLLSKNNNKMVFDVKTDEIALLNKYLVSNNISVSAIVPTRSLEEYFLKITDESN